MSFTHLDVELDMIDKEIQKCYLLRVKLESIKSEIERRVSLCEDNISFLKKSGIVVSLNSSKVVFKEAKFLKEELVKCELGIDACLKSDFALYQKRKELRDKMDEKLNNVLLFKKVEKK